MRHPFPPDSAPSANPRSTRRLRIALGTWVAIEARVGPRWATGSSAVDAGATTRSEPPLSSHNIAQGEPPLSSRLMTPSESPFPRPATSDNEARDTSEHAAIEAAYAAIRDIDIRMHPRREGSEIALINSAEPGMPIELQPDTWRLLQLARRLYDLTEGIFDPCLPTRPGRLSDIEI
jgi:ApbE family